MFLLIITVNEDNIIVNYAENVEVFSEGVERERLQDGQDSGESERHDQILQKAVKDAEGSLRFFRFLDGKVVVSVKGNQLGVYECP